MPQMSMPSRRTSISSLTQEATTQTDVRFEKKYSQAAEVSHLRASREADFLREASQTLNMIRNGPRYGDVSNPDRKPRRSPRLFPPESPCLKWSNASPPAIARRARGQPDQRRKFMQRRELLRSGRSINRSRSYSTHQDRHFVDMHPFQGANMVLDVFRRNSHALPSHYGRSSQRL